MEKLSVCNTRKPMNVKSFHSFYFLMKFQWNRGLAVNSDRWLVFNELSIKIRINDLEISNCLGNKLDIQDASGKSERWFLTG